MTLKLNHIMQAAARRSDIIVASFILLAVVMMIIPIPTYLVDVMVSCNIAFTVLVLIVAFYSAKAVDFSALPPVILLSTLFRLSLSITTTRLILRDADAGRIVAAFGEYVVAGDVVVGIVIFLIITVAQFIVITKGAERVAEVGARFTLDAMPGKQMSIDADLRNGDINQEEARGRRQYLERESQLFGAMDGAMKFVKGDAIASLIILCVNLIGGIVIGTVRQGMSLSDAAHTYSLLTVGDGLIAQLPALMTAIAAGIVVTRVNSGRDVDLGAEIIGQLGARSKVLALCAVVLVLLALVPGFPAYTFVALALFLGGAAFVLKGRQAPEDEQADHDGEVRDERDEELVVGDAMRASRAAAEWVDPPAGRLTLHASAEMAGTLSLDALKLALEDARMRAELALGLSVAPIGFTLDAQLSNTLFSICLDGVPVASGVLYSDCVFVQDNVQVLETLGIQPRAQLTFNGQDAAWVPRQHEQEIAGLEGRWHTPEEALAEYLLVALLQHAPEFLGIQETRQLLGELEQGYPELVRQALHTTPLPRMVEVFRRLLQEGVSIGNLRAILEALVQMDEGSPLHSKVERLRTALSRHICHRYADEHRAIGVYVLSRELEHDVRRGMQSEDGRNIPLPIELGERLTSGLQAVPRTSGKIARPVLMTASDIRRYLRHHLEQHGIDIPVMAYAELAQGYVSHPLVVLGPDGRPEAPPPDTIDTAPLRKAA